MLLKDKGFELVLPELSSADPLSQQAIEVSNTLPPMDRGRSFSGESRSMPLSLEGFYLGAFSEFEAGFRLSEA